MSLIVSLIAIGAVVVVGAIGGLVPALHPVFGVVIPYAALAVFILGFIWRVLRWAKSPVPFPIATTAGQQKSLPWIKQDKLENPSTRWQVVDRMILEIVLFRSLFRNTRMELYKENGKLTYGWQLWLWAFALAFHYSFLVVVLRHLRFFLDPIPLPVTLLESVDGFLQVGLPSVMISGFVLLGAVGYLLVRRLYVPFMRYISLPSDYFPLFLIASIAATGILMRYVVRVDVVGVRELTLGIATLNPVVPDGINFLFYIHLFLVCVLLAYFPFSKLMHLGGIFMSPTRNLRGNSREFRHVNPWNYPVKTHTYDEYEEEFRDRMIEAGLPVEKQPAESGSATDTESAEDSAE
ncbi:MAG: sulfate reduction electron transfer complex DsrMKJOP subunit DsrM [Deltaproteobacteria bacterium]|nr:sulfate reduction electron transfer complex DsrMKJOP subunit DsrM [Deltaproteobacteria bacterium]